MVSSVAEMIGDRIDILSASERRAAQILIANYPLAGLKTVAEFASLAGVSPPTVLRFVARLGYQNYAEFQARLQEELAEQLQSPLSRTVAAKTGGEDREFPLVAATIDNLRETFRHISQIQLDGAIAAMANRKGRIYLVGGRFTDPIAAYVAAHLAIVRPGVLHLSGQESNWRDRLIDMGRNDALVVFDIRRYQDSLLRLAEAAARRGVRVVLVTDQWLSPIARHARVVIAGRTAVPSAWDSSASLFVVAETLIAEVTRRLEGESAKRMREMEALRGS
jgi:DNA-binding MurR/RpiR family transcriptional regulator